MCFHAVVFGEKTETRCVSVFSQVDSDKSDTRQRLYFVSGFHPGHGNCSGSSGSRHK